VNKHRPQFSGNDPLLTPMEVSAHLKVPLATIYQWASKGIGPRSSKMGKHRRYRSSDVNQWVESETSPEILR
jgi:excisionase family DNA binding protein